ncbi:MAG TPA: hypothetical protein VK508_18400 [Cyclobacteriaceae bacterium]|nr:hypothetical protein [Cyclobacteriaceae bacterium]
MAGSRPTRSRRDASWETTITSTTNTLFTPDGRSHASGEIFGYYMIARQYYNRY